MNDIAEAVCSAVDTVIKGKHEIVEEVFAAILAGGNILMEDIPGVGKTTLAKTFAKILSLDNKRVQFTPDVLPSDILGFSMYDKESGKFAFREGAVFTNLLLADEINRTSPKTQSALLEAMAERSVTVDGVTRRLPDPFVVIATENPYGSSGTQKLPGSQLDRFMISITMGYPSRDDEIMILKGDSSVQISDLSPVLTKEGLKDAMKKTAGVSVSDDIYGYIADLSAFTRNGVLFSAGMSPRGAKALLMMSKAFAFMAGRDYVLPEDVQRAVPDVIKHRTIVSQKARFEGYDGKRAATELISSVQPPRS